MRTQETAPNWVYGKEDGSAVPIFHLVPALSDGGRERGKPVGGGGD